MWFKLSRIILKNRLIILILVGLATVFMGYEAQFAKMSYQMAQLLPASDKTYQEYQDFKTTFGKDGSVVVIGVNNDKLYQLKNFNAWYNLTYNIKNIKTEFVKNGTSMMVNGVTEALSTANAYNIVKNKTKKRFDFEQIVKSKPKTQAELDSLENILHHLPFYKGYYMQILQTQL